jgi:two-component system, OmpR family, response regulator
VSKILVVEDDSATANVVKETLGQNGHSVDIAHNARDAKAFIDTYIYNIILLDWQLPQNVTGVDFLKSYRAAGGTAPVLMMTSRSSIDDKETGFRAGADDFLQKPFHTRELVLRVEALLRGAAAMPGNLISVGRLKLDTVKHVAFAGETELMLRPKEYAMLEHFMRHPGYVFSHETLIKAIWPSDHDTSDLAVRGTIKRLRQQIVDAIGEDPIETVHGMGYKLKAAE